jgi:peroxiredoxin
VTRPPPTPPEGGSQAGGRRQPPADALTRLDPDAAGSAPRDAADGPVAPPPPAEIDTRRYRWTIGIIGLALVVAFSMHQFAAGGTRTTGVAPGQRLHWFAAPLAATDLDGDANLRPPCTEAQHDPRALNLCLDAHRSAVVLSFFVPGSAQCVRQVDALQALVRRFAGASVTFAAVAIRASHAQVARLVRGHRWTIPVAYDADGAVGEQYGVVACPMAELASRGGIVRDRLIGDRWQTAAQLAPRVAALLRSPG